MRDVRAALIPVEKIRFHSHNVRRDLGDLRSLSASIRRFGVMQPVIVEDWGSDYRLRAGHRRVAASRMAGLARVPALIHQEMLSDEDWLVQAVQENVIRRGLDYRDRADAISALRACDCTWEGIAQAFDVTAETVRRWALGKPDDETTRTPAPTTTTTSAVAPVKPRKAPSVIARSRIRGLVEQWRGKPEATAADVLDALADLIEDTRP